MRMWVPGMARYEAVQYCAELSGKRTLTVSASKRVAVSSQVSSSPAAWAFGASTAAIVSTSARRLISWRTIGGDRNCQPGYGSHTTEEEGTQTEMAAKKKAASVG